VGLAVWVVAPTGRDAELVAGVLRHNRIDAAICSDLSTLDLLMHESAGLLIVAEEALVPSFVQQLRGMVGRQPAWSDLPVLILTGTVGPNTMQQLEYQRLAIGTPVLLERPIRTENLLSSVQAALRARQRQFEMRDTLRERDRALAALKQERETLQVVLDNLPVGVILAKPTGQIVLGNKTTERIVRHPILETPDVSSHARWTAFHPEGHRVKGEEFPLPRAMASGKPVPPEDYLYQRGDGTRAWVSLAAAPILDEQGQVTGGVAAISDIDQQKRTAADLQRSNERFRRLIEHASVGVIIGDFDGDISYANPTILNLLGYTADEVQSLPLRWDDLTPPEYAAADRKAIAELRGQGTAETYQKVYRAKDGRLIPLLVGATIIPAQQGEAIDQVAVFVTDMSSQKQAESALIQSEKLAAVGRLAASISHEINNPLEAVTNLIFLARMEQELPDRVRLLLDTADQELQRVSQITAQTLRFHRQSTNARVVRLEDLLEPALMLYKGRLFNAQIQVEEQHRGAAAIECFDGDIRQVLNNLIGNAVDAMRQGGRLIIRTSNTWMHREQMPGVRISIADSGPGMVPEVLQRIYEPFYTTKGINGSGLGLWISRGIVEKHFGHLQLRSRVTPGQSGTVFSMVLPVMHENLVRPARVSRTD
jgi:PAS domain S-box-containing protein